MDVSIITEQQHAPAATKLPARAVVVAVNHQAGRIAAPAANFIIRHNEALIGIGLGLGAYAYAGSGPHSYIVNALGLAAVVELATARMSRAIVTRSYKWVSRDYRATKLDIAGISHAWGSIAGAVTFVGAIIVGSMSGVALYKTSYNNTPAQAVHIVQATHAADAGSASPPQRGVLDRTGKRPTLTL